jgi:hypothetical protein
VTHPMAGRLEEVPVPKKINSMSSERGPIIAWQGCKCTANILLRPILGSQTVYAVNLNVCRVFIYFGPIIGRPARVFHMKICEEGGHNTWCNKFKCSQHTLLVPPPRGIDNLFPKY